MRELKAAVERATGSRLEERRLGSTEELKGKIAAIKGSSDDPMAYVMLQYQWAMVTGKAKLDPLDNARYPEVEPISVEAFIRQSAERSA